MEQHDWLKLFIAVGVASLLVGLGYVVGYWRGCHKQAEIKQIKLKDMLEPGWDRNE